MFKWEIALWYLSYGCGERMLVCGLVVTSGHCYGLLYSCKNSGKIADYKIILLSLLKILIELDLRLIG